MYRAAAYILFAFFLPTLIQSSALISAAEMENASEKSRVNEGVLPLTPAESSAAPASESSLPESSVHPPAVIAVPNDPCLPGLYADWQEFSQDHTDNQRSEYKWLRIHIDRLSFQLVLEGIRKDGSTEEIHRTHVALGDMNSPTPQGRFIINHIYCYPDVVFFDTQIERIPDLYNGFFAPLLICNEQGRCERFRELGLHGFQASAIPVGRHISPATVGAVSAGCIRIPDPCRFKKTLIKAVGLGSIKQNDRGTYHWLRKPVEVVISDGHPDSDETNLASIIEQGVMQLQDGLKSLFNVFR